MKKIITLLGLAILISGCATLTPIYRQEYNFSQPLPEVTIGLTAQGQVWNMVAKNNTNETIKFLPDDSSYVTTDGRTERIIRGHTRRIHSGLSQPPIPIPPNAKYEEAILTESGVDLTDFQLSYYPLRPGNPDAPGRFYFVFEINGQKKISICEVKFIKEKEEYKVKGLQ